MTVHFGARLLDVQNHPDGKGATVIWMPSKDFFADPSIDPKSTTDERFRAFKADVVVGADGVKSAVRAALELPSPPEAGIRENQMAKERYTGTYCYRGLIPIKDALEVSERFAIPRMWFGKGKHILIFPIEQGTVSLHFPYGLTRSAWYAFTPDTLTDIPLSDRSNSLLHSITDSKHRRFCF